ncbi:family 16 glycosylhydrolase [uncultured Actinomyces sp.]|uniref:family 16 glycosylhydrolase n=1 Tax=uncultured Actinomyces sp. TaxID=249061 RepID=UPI00262D1F1F|nr:family 16 glycosylhydrolase [uncultured Actinomyces sp.]
MAHVKTNRFSGNRAVRTLGAFTLGAAMTVGGLSFASAGDVQPTPNEVQALGYNTLIFQDEFTGNELDTSKWGYEYSCFDPKTRSQAQYTDSKENASVSGGNLHLTAKYEPTRQKYDSRSRSMVTVDRECTRTVNGRSETYKAPFNSAMVQTRDNKGIKYAAYGDFYAEARIKLPNAVASWPAFWMTGIAPASFPAHGEIDVVEAKGRDPNFLQANVHTPRVGEPQKTEQHMGQLGGNGTSQTQFHTYGVEKNGNSITFYLDGKRGHTVTYDQVKGDNPFINDANGMVLRLNHMVGGSFLASERGDTTYTDAIKFKEAYQGAGSDMLVDYVRVWKKNGNATSEPAPLPSTATADPEPSAQPTATTAPAPMPTTAAPQPSSEVTAQPSAPAEPTSAAPSTQPTASEPVASATTQRPPRARRSADATAPAQPTEEASSALPTRPETTASALSEAPANPSTEGTADTSVSQPDAVAPNEQPALSQLLPEASHLSELGTDRSALTSTNEAEAQNSAVARNEQAASAQNPSSARALAATGSSSLGFVFAGLLAVVGVLMLAWPTPATAQHMSFRRK